MVAIIFVFLRLLRFANKENVESGKPVVIDCLFYFVISFNGKRGRGVWVA